MDKITFDNVGPREEITNRLRSLLDGYKDGLSIIKEMIQNADDAKATTVKICLDMNAQKSLLDPDSPHKQGHALFFYNDSQFEDHDFKNISLLGAGTKSDSPEKIGQFGLGFTSVYNVTDNPSVISRNKFMIFDPAVDKLKGFIRDSSNPGLMIDFDHRDFDSFAKAFLPFDGIFGCQITKGYSFPGTLIRLPFRKSPSKISDNIYSPESAGSLFEILISNADKLLLFTQSVKRIELHVLAEGSSEMELVYKFQVSIEQVLKSHGIGLSGLDSSDRQLASLQAESSLLRAAVENKNNQHIKRLDNAIVVTSKTFVNHSSTQYSRLFKQPISSASHKPETHWLIVSSFSRANLQTGEHWDKFIPCVGMALSVEKDNDGWRLCSDSSAQDFDGSLFCFLPLSISSCFRLHVNCTFMLTEDRTRIFERSREDRTTCHKHEWNEHLVDPIVDNLLTLLAKASVHLGIRCALAAVEWMFPIGSGDGYFKKIEASFYARVCSPTTNEPAFPAEDINACTRLHAFKDCVFVDFDVGAAQLQRKAVQLVTLIFRKNQPVLLMPKFLFNKSASPKNVIQLPSTHLARIKSLASDQTKFLTELALLDLLIRHRVSVPTDDYQQLITHFLRTKCVDADPAYATLIKTNRSILSSNSTFKLPSELIDKRSNQQFTSLFEEADDHFLNDDYYKNDVVMLALGRLGLIVNKLPDEFILGVARHVNQLPDTPKAKRLSKELLKYCQLNPINSALSSQLLNIEWVFCKSRPSYWAPILKWAGNDQQLVKPVGLLSDLFEDHAGCVEPVLERGYCDLLGLKAWESPRLVKSSIRQLEYLSSLKETGHSTEIEKMFTAFVELVKTSSVGAEVYKSLPSNWLYCHDNEKARFLGKDSLAMRVENPVFPELFGLPWIYKKDKLATKFFKSAGIEETFSIDSLKAKLSRLKQEHGVQPLTNAHTRKVCSSIFSEMIDVGDPELLRNLKKDEDFFMPDTDYVLRKASLFCTKLTGRDACTEMFVLHESLLHVSSRFGIEDSRKMISQAIGEPFGQREELSNRIKQILKGYDTRARVFTEMIQNADDAGASEISFVVDWRQLDTKNVFGECFEPLQGPALCCWNNAVFTEADYKGIVSLGNGSKRTDLNKTGRFGVGINTQFHITDAIQFISDEDKYVILDPLCKHYPHLDSTNPGRKIDVKNLGGIYSDVLSGFRLGSDAMPLKASTMFRFSLRTHKPTDPVNFLSTQLVNAAEMQQMMLDFAKTAYETLIFLKNIRKISFYKLDANNNIRLLHSHQASLESDSDRTRLADFWKDFTLRTKTDFKFRQIICKKISINLTIHSSVKNKADLPRRFHVRQQFGFESLEYSNNQEEIDSLDLNKTDKFYPLAGIAYERDLSRKATYKLYNFLPLHQDSPIACHVNGYFALHHENRTQLFEGTHTGLINQSTAKWSTDWNKALIGRIVLPLYLETIRERLSDERDRPEALIEHFYRVFPTNRTTPEELKDYFKFMIKEFYRKAFEIECIPVYCPHESGVKILRPSQLLFAKNLTDFLKKLISNNGEVNEICDIVSDIVKDYCKYDSVSTMFKLYGGIDLKQLDTQSFLMELKDMGLRLVGVEVSQSIFRSIKNVASLLNFCLDGHDDFSFLEEVPLLISSDNIIRQFSSTNPLFHLKAEYTSYFEKSGLKFLHPELLKIWKLTESLPFFKKFNIVDLSTVCQMLFEKNQQADVDDFAEAHDDIKKPLILIWQFIIQHQKSLGDISRSQQIEQLAPIEGWPLVPVLSTSSIRLAPLSHIEMIKTGRFYQLEKLLDQFPTIQSNFFDSSFQSDFRKFINRLAMDPCSRPADLVILLSSISSPSFSLRDSETICSTLDNSFNKPYDKNTETYFTSLLRTDESLNLRTDPQLKAMIKEMPIFQSYTSTELIRLTNKRAYAIKSSPGTSIEVNLFDKYLLANSLVLIKSTYTDLKSFLAIEDRSLVQFYKEFLVWNQGQPQDPQVCKKLMTLLKDRYASELVSTEFDQKLAKTLGQIRFITIGNQAFMPSELHDRANKLFVAGFKNRILPDEYYSDEWLPFLRFLKLKVTPSDEDLLELASIFTHQFENKLMDATQLKNLSDELIKQLTKNKGSRKPDSTIVAQLRKVKFLPSYFLTSPPSIHLKVFNPTNGNVSLEGAFSKDHIDFVWTTNAILPDNPIWKSDPDYKQNVAEPSCSLIVTNFICLMNKCSNNQFLASLDETEIQELEALFVRFYTKLEGLLKTNNNNLGEISRLKDLACVWNERDGGHVSLDKPACFFKDIAREESVPPYILKMPSMLNKFPQLLTMFAFPDKVTFEACAKALKDLAVYEGSKLSDVQLDSFRSLYKFFLFDDMLREDVSSVQFYAPNSEGILHKLQDLYYDLDGDENFEYVRRHAPRSILDELNLMFDIGLVRKRYLTTSGRNKQGDSCLKNTAVFNELISWQRVFGSMPYFVKNSTLAPKPLSDLIECRIKETDNGPIGVDETGTKLNSVIRSSSFFDFIKRECTRHSNMSIEPEVSSRLKVSFDSLTVMVKQEIISSYYNRKTNRKIELKEQIHDFFVNKSGVNEKRLVFSSLLSLYNCVYYLTEIVGREIVEASPSAISETLRLNLRCKINEYLLNASA